jgi:hypothetical protein
MNTLNHISVYDFLAANTKGGRIGLDEDKVIWLGEEEVLNEGCL